MRILFTTDGSADAERAARLLVELDWREDDRLTIVSVLPHYEFLSGHASDEHVGWWEKLSAAEGQAADRAVHQAAELLAPAFKTVETRVLAGVPAEEILRIARELWVDLIVVGKRGCSAIKEWLLGSVSQSVVDRAPCSVLIVPSRAPDQISRVVVACDGSLQAEAGLDCALRMPLPDWTQIEILCIAEPVVLPMVASQLPYPIPGYTEVMADLESRHREQTKQRAREAADRVRVAGRSAVSKVRAGAPAEEIEAEVCDYSADLVVVGAHTKKGWLSDFLGNTARSVIRRSECAVLVGRLLRVEPDASIVSEARLKEDPRERVGAVGYAEAGLRRALGHHGSRTIEV